MNLKQDIWVDAFAQRLLQDCPRIGASDAEHIGESLWRDPAWRRCRPAVAAPQWLAQVGFRAPLETT